MPSKVAFDPEEPSLGRIQADSIAPPHSPTTIKLYISRVEGIPTLTYANLFADISCTTPLKEGHISILGTNCPGMSPKKPMAVVTVQRDTVQRDMVQRDMVQRDMVQRDMVQRDTVQRDMVQRDMVQRDMVQRDMVQRDMVQRGTVQRDAVRRGTFQRDTVQVRYSSIPDGIYVIKNRVASIYWAWGSSMKVHFWPTRKKEAKNSMISQVKKHSPNIQVIRG